MKRFCLWLIVFSFISVLHAQQTKVWNNWYFGYYYALTFNTDTPSLLHNSAMYAMQGCSSISDKNGKLLFYTNGDSIFYPDGTVMENSKPLDSGICFNSVEGAVILKKPGCNSIYYVFTAPILKGKSAVNYYTYAIVDMSKKGGMGKVISRWNHFYSTTSIRGLSGSITAARIANDSAWWILVKNEKNHFMAFRFDETGLSPKPVMSNPTSYGESVICVSPKGNIIATGNGIYNFNDTTGEVISLLDSIHDFFPPGHLSFSPDGSKVYYFSGMMDSLSFTTDLDFLYQIDLNSYRSGRFTSKRIISAPGQLLRFEHSGMRLGPDHKIYVLKKRMKSYYSDTVIYSLSVINCPDSSLEKCRFEEDKYFLGSYLISNPRPGIVDGLPFVPHDVLAIHPLPSFSYYMDTCSGIFKFQNQTITSEPYYWNFGDGSTSSEKNPVHAYSDSGNYTVTLASNFKGDDCGDTVIRLVKFPGNPEQFIKTYNVFTPDDDGINDRFEIGMLLCPDYQIEIFNRWGQEIYDQSGDHLSWDGKANNMDLPAGNYFFVLKKGERRVRTGTVVLLR